MSRLEQLAPDQHAVLSLLVRQGRTYAQVAGMLAIDDAAVRARAQRALSTLGGPRPAELAVGESEQIGDYLLGQLDDAQRIETLAQLTDTAAGRAWARTVAGELSSLATVPLPAVPEEPRSADEEPGWADEEPGWADEEPGWADEEPRQAAGESLARGHADEDRRERTPRGQGAEVDRGGGVLLLAAVLAIAALVVFIVGGGTSSPPPGPIPASAATQTATSSTSSPGLVTQLSLKPTAAGSQATGAVAIVRSGSTLQIAFSAAHLPQPGSAHYVLWLYDSPTHFEALGVIGSVKADGSVAPLATALPADASSYHGVALTLDTSNSASTPGPVVLSGTSSSPL